MRLRSLKIISKPPQYPMPPIVDLGILTPMRDNSQHTLSLKNLLQNQYLHIKPRRPPKPPTNP